MAQKKKSSKKNIKKKNQLPKWLIIVVLVLVVGFCLYVGLTYYPTMNKDYHEIDTTIEEVDASIDKVVSSDMDLRSLISGRATVVKWSSNNPNVISAEGKVTRPTYTDGDKVVVLKATYTIPLKDGLAQILYDILGFSEKEASYKVRVLCLDPTDVEKVEIAGDSLYVPDEMFASVNLPTAYPLFDGVEISWVSNNNEVINSQGTITTPATDTDVVLIATIKSNSEIQNYEFSTKILASEKELDHLSIDFNDVAVASKNGSYKQLVKNGVTFNNVKVFEEEGQTESTDPSENADYSERYIKLKSTKDAFASFETEMINDVATFSFNYTYSGSQSGSNSFLEVYKKQGEDWVLVEKHTILHDGQKLLSYQINESTALKVVFSTTYAECYVNIDNVKVTRNINEEDLKTYVVSNIPTRIQRYANLPYTTCYGGKVTYTSSNEAVITNLGKVVTTLDDTKEVTLNATIEYLGHTYTTEVVVKVSGITAGSPIEIFFIDIGKYGQADCGESIYIKYGSKDILIDAGDNFESTKKAIDEVVNQHLDDGILEYVIATHPDGDHIGGMPAIFEKYKVENLITFDGSHTSQKYQNYKKAYEDEGCNVFNIYTDIMQKNDTLLTLDENVNIEFMDTKYYDAEVSKETNGRSIVFVLNAYDTRVLFTGDADSQSSHSDLEANYQDKVGNIDILKVVHHGTKEGTYLDFLKACDPEVAIICNGNYLGNKHAHPGVSTIETLYNYDSAMKVYCITGGGGADDCEIASNGSYKCSSDNYMLDRNGTITLIINDGGYTISSEYYNETPKELKDTTWWNGYLSLKK